MEEKAFHKLAAEIARALGGKVTRRNEPGNPFFADFATGEGLPLDVATAWNEPGKLRVRVVMPRKGDSACTYLARDLYSRDEITPDTDIGVSAAKGAERIAADIRRRLIPGATDAHKRATVQKASADAYRKGTAETVAMLRKALKCEEIGRFADSDCVRGAACEFRVSGPQSIQMERVYVTPETALKIHALLLADKGGDE